MADLNDLLRGRDQTEAESWMPVRWWAGTEKANQIIDSGDGQPFEILVRNGYCKEMRDAEQQFQLTRRVRIAVETTNGSDPQDAAMKASEEFMVFERKQVERILTRNWRNLVEAGEPVPCNPDKITWLFDQFPQIYDQVWTWAHTGANYPGSKNGHIAVDPVTEIEKKSSSGSDGDSVVASESEQTTALEM